MKKTPLGSFALRIGASLLGAGVAVGACGGSPEAVLPGPSTGAQPSRAGSGATVGGTATDGGAAAAADAGAGGELKACPVYAPDRCSTRAASEGATGESCVSTQSDAQNCGKCGATCKPQAACAAGTCLEPPEQLAASTGCGDVRLALQGSRLIWSEHRSGNVRVMAITGGAITEISSGRLGPAQITADESAAYWYDAGDGTPGSSRVLTTALSGDGPTTTLKTAPGSDSVTGLTMAGGKVYFGLGHDVHAISTDPNDATDVVVGVAIARNDQTMPDGVPAALSVHDGRVYWIVSDVGSVESDDLLPGANAYARVGHSGQLLPTDLGFAGDYVYYAAFESLYAAQVNQPAIAIASSNDYSPLTAFAVDADTGYFADQGGHVSRHSLALPAAPDFEPTPSVTLARDQGNVTSMVLDGTHVYWASVEPTSGDCAIRALGL